MARAAVLGRLTWQLATLVESVAETADVRTLVLDAPEWPGHLPGQHLDVRLTAEDGYQAQRSYSIASAPGDRLALTVQRLADGEVSPYLVDELRPGDELELRGPIGGYFVWAPGRGGPLLLVAGGSGIVPLMAMIRARAEAGDETPVRLLYSSRTIDDVVYREELDRLAGDGVEVVHTLTRTQPDGWTGYARRVDAPMLGGGGVAARHGRRHVRLRLDAVRGARGPHARRPRASAREHSDGAYGGRRERRSLRLAPVPGRNSAPMSETYLDGNAIGGLLWEVFGVEMTVATGVCAACGAGGPRGGAPGGGAPAPRGPAPRGAGEGGGRRHPRGGGGPAPPRRGGGTGIVESRIRNTATTFTTGSWFGRERLLRIQIGSVWSRAGGERRHDHLVEREREREQRAGEERRAQLRERHVAERLPRRPRRGRRRPPRTSPDVRRSRATTLL